MKVLDIKLYRDLGRLWAQALAIALVMACGVATLILSVGAYRSLEDTRAAFYDRYRFGTVFASATRAPQHLKSRIENISGVASAELRIVRPVLIDVVGMEEPASGVVVSVPEFREPAVNRLYLRHGRLPEAGRENEVAVVETFADAHGFRPGDTFEAIMNGRKQTLKIVGTVLSPEYIYAIGPGDMVPDPKRYGVFFMSKKALAGLFDMEGAFNDVSLSTIRNSETRAIIDDLDDMLKPYGGTGAYDREDQISHAFLDSELDQLQAMSSIIPPIFLAIAAFLVNMILSRLIALEREQIGLLKALGYGTWTIGGHYAKLVVAIALVGLVIGSVAGWWLGRGLTRLYAEFFSFPFLIFRQSIDLYFLAGGVTIAAALAGAANAIWSTVALPPAVAMSPPAPTTYRSFFFGRLQRLGILSQLTVMAMRHLVRWPVRTFLTTLGTSMSVALLVTSLFAYDSIDFMIDAIFFQADRQDATLTFSEDLGPGSLYAVAALPGVVKAEPYRQTAVKLRNGHRELRMSLLGVPEEANLSRILDLDLNPMSAPSAGIVLSERVAEKLHLQPGDFVEVELLERDNRIVEVEVGRLAQGPVGSPDTGGPSTPGAIAVSAVAQSYVGLTAYMQSEALDRLLRDGRRVSGTRIQIDSAGLSDLYDEIKRTPAIASIALQGVSRMRFRETIEQNITTSTAVYITLAVIITFGVIYNSARIQLSERARELASLRVFGFTRTEVSGVLMTELAIIVLLAQPLGWLLGYGLSWSVVQGFANDLFRIPLVVSAQTFAISSLVVIIAAVVSALIVRRRVDRLDLIRVLKTRE
ncbi:ABC transporter permease [Hoeflea sp. TYP-13]|uniref:ABC transporter permease n=1 Tax=Hoeflea sp. TYP-13 TaxID=3230023 RepID=UPI0034C6126F